MQTPAYKATRSNPPSHSSSSTPSPPPPHSLPPFPPACAPRSTSYLFPLPVVFEEGLQCVQVGHPPNHLRVLGQWDHRVPTDTAGKKYINNTTPSLHNTTPALHKITHSLHNTTNDCTTPLHIGLVQTDLGQAKVTTTLLFTGWRWSSLHHKQIPCPSQGFLRSVAQGFWSQGHKQSTYSARGLYTTPEQPTTARTIIFSLNICPSK